MEWNVLINDFILSMNFVRCNDDKCIYVKRFDNNDIIYIGLYVDDIIVCGNKIAIVNDVKKRIGSKFKCKDLGEIKKYLGITITRNRKNRIITLSMKDYIDKMLDQFGMSKCNIRSTPVEYKSVPNKSMCPTTPDDIAYMNNIPYSNAVGELMYLSVTTRPDISYAVSLYSRYMQNPGRMHWEGVKNIFRYLRGTSHIGITYGGYDAFHSPDKNRLVAYSDSDWAGCPDSRKSLSGYLIMLNGGPVQWKSKVQSIVAHSSTEAEYIAVSVVCNEIVWIKRVLDFLGYSQHTTSIHVDNRSAICLAESEKDDRRTRHIDVKYHLIKGLVNSKQIVLHHISGTDNPADMFTKSETVKMFMSMRNVILKC